MFKFASGAPPGIFTPSAAHNHFQLTIRQKVIGWKSVFTYKFPASSGFTVKETDVCFIVTNDACCGRDGSLATTVMMSEQGE
jgi:hypothetical protein